MAARIRQLEHENGVLNLANETMHRNIAQGDGKLQRAEAERTGLAEDLRRLNEEMRRKEVAITRLNEQLAKAQKTIKVQSDQIQAPKEAARPPPPPQHPGHHPPSFSHSFGPAPPMFGRTYGNQPMPYPDPMSRRPSMIASHGMLVAQGNTFSEINMMPEFTPFFNLTERWSHNFTNVPDKARDQSMPGFLKDALTQNTNASIATKLMASGNTRFLTVAKLINYNITNFAFRPVLTKGFTQYFDNKTTELRNQLQTGIPLHVRRALLMACAETTVEMSKVDGFERYLDGIANQKATETWQLMEPLFAPGVAVNEAWQELKRIWGEAARIGVLMLSKPSTFGMDYPPVGRSSYFNPSQMISRDMDFMQNPQTLGNMAAKVRLAITPIVTETDFLGSAVVPKTLHYSNVLLEL